MAPRRRRASFPTVVIERETESEESSSEEEDEEPEPEVPEEEEEGEQLAEVESGEKVDEGLGSKKKERVPITISLTKVCKVRLPLFFLFPVGFENFLHFFIHFPSMIMFV